MLAELSAAPPASAPMKRTLVSFMKGWNSPIEFEPPPTQASSTSGRRPSALRICARASLPMTLWKSRTIAG